MTKPPLIQLRAMEPEDLDVLYRIENDTELWNVGATNVPYSRYALHDYIAQSTGDIYADRQVRLIIEDRENGCVAGLADLFNFDPRHRRAEIGLVIERDYRNKGIAQTVVTQLHHYALHTVGLHQLYVVIGIDNAPALHLFHKLDYIESAHLSDWLYDGHAYHDAVVLQKKLV